MNKALKFFGFLMWVIVLQLKAQPYAVGHTTLSLTDASRSNRSIPVEVYYPASSAGDNVPVAGGRKYPCIAFGHGFLMTWDAYKNVWNALVPQGFIIAFPKTEGTAAPSHLEFGKDLSFVLSAMDLQGKNASSLFYNKVDTMNCIMGHSMGGGAAFLGASLSSKIKCIATLAAAETNPKATTAASGLTIPSLTMAAGNDCVTPPSGHQIPMFDSLKSLCKTYVSIAGGSHCQMSEDNLLCNLGESTCFPKPTISRTTQHQAISRFLIPWLRFHLLKDCRSGQTFDSLAVKDAAVSVRKNCVLCPTNLVSKPARISVTIYPNPATTELYLTLHPKIQQIKCTMYNSAGQKCGAWSQIKVSKASALLPLQSGLTKGIYFLNVESDGEQENLPILIE